MNVLCLENQKGRYFHGMWNMPKDLPYALPDEAAQQRSRDGVLLWVGSKREISKVCRDASIRSAERSGSAKESRWNSPSSRKQT
jgi:hypothetical protein